MILETYESRLKLSFTLLIVGTTEHCALSTEVKIKQVHDTILPTPKSNFRRNLNTTLNLSLPSHSYTLAQANMCFAQNIINPNKKQNLLKLIGFSHIQTHTKQWVKHVNKLAHDIYKNQSNILQNFLTLEKNR